MFLQSCSDEEKLTTVLNGLCKLSVNCHFGVNYSFTFMLYFGLEVTSVIAGWVIYEVEWFSDVFGLCREVFKAKHRQTGKKVALKKVLMENEKEGVRTCSSILYRNQVIRLLDS